PGLNFACFTTRSASSSQPPPIPRITLGSSTLPCSVTINWMVTKPSILGCSARRWYSILPCSSASRPISSGICSTATNKSSSSSSFPSSFVGGGRSILSLKEKSASRLISWSSMTSSLGTGTGTCGLGGGGGVFCCCVRITSSISTTSCSLTSCTSSFSCFHSSLVAPIK